MVRVYTFVRLKTLESGRDSGWYLLIPAAHALIEWNEIRGNKGTPYAMIRLAMAFDNNRYDEDLKYAFVRSYSTKGRLSLIEFKKLISLTRINELLSYDTVMASVSGDLFVFNEDKIEILEEIRKAGMEFPKDKRYEKWL
jgi:hypothetical protein